MKFTWSIKILMLLFVFSSCGEEGEIVGEEHEDLLYAFIDLHKNIEKGNIQNISFIENEISQKLQHQMAVLNAQNASIEEQKLIKGLLENTKQIKLLSKNLINEIAELQSNIINKSIKTNKENYTIDEYGYFVLIPLEHLELHNNQQAANEVLLNNHVQNFLLDSLENYRNQICFIIGNLPGDKNNSFDFTSSSSLENNFSENAFKNFEKNIGQSLRQVEKRNQYIFKQTYQLLSYPRKIQRGDKKGFWMEMTFRNTPEVNAVAQLSAIRSDIILSEKLAMQYINSKVNITRF